MAKCSICNTRKGKRQCIADSTVICSLCCGQSRTQDKCTGCSFYKDESSNRNYRKVPFFEIQEMSNSPELQDISYVVEAVFVAFDLESEEFTDKTAEKLLELAFDKYHFQDSVLPFSNVEERDWFQISLKNYSLKCWPRYIDQYKDEPTAVESIYNLQNSMYERGLVLGQDL